MMKLGMRTEFLRPSPTMAMSAKANELQQKGVDVVSLTLGEPDWQTYSSISQAGIQAIQTGFTKYTHAAGIMELRKQVAQTTSEQLALPFGFSPQEVVIGTGAKYIIFAALHILLDPGSEVIIPAPYWVSYPTMVELAGGVSRFVDCTEASQFKLTPESLEKAITEKTRLLILCSPSNPTGIMYSKEELLALAEVLRRQKHVSVISDDIYNRLLFSSEKVAPHLLQVAPDLRDRVFIVNGASKAYSMTGWRIGWGLGPQKVIGFVTDYISQSTSNACSISQKAALHALKNCESDIENANQLLKEKYQWFYHQLSLVKGFKPYEAQGAFYIWLQVSDCFGKTHRSPAAERKILNSKDLADLLLTEYFLATVPGSDFGTEGYLRLSFATSQENLQKAVDRFQKISAELF